MRGHFRLDPDVHFLNHGSFGATPRPVLRYANALRKQMERQPVRFFQQDLPALGEEALDALGAYVGAGEDVVFVPNATSGVNIVAASLVDVLRPGDEVLGTNHEYGACANAWEAACARSGARYVRCMVPLPSEMKAESQAEKGGEMDAGEQVVEAIWAGVTERTRVIFLSHITSPTAHLWPVERLTARARAAGILTVVDGAHAPGMIPLQMAEVGADFYTANCHKWLCAPKSSGFLFARPEVQHLLRPLVVSWGSLPERQFNSGRDFRDAFVWAGTLDYAPYLAVPAAIAFQAAHQWPSVVARCSALLDEWLPRLASVVGLAPIYAGPPGAQALRPPQLAITPLPSGLHAATLKARLLDEFRVEAPVVHWRYRLFVRISVQAYTDADDFEALHDALAVLAGAGNASA